MENATKALLIAAAVLVAILIISLGLAIYNRSSSAADAGDLTDVSIQAQNEKFLKYDGDRKRGSDVNALLQTVLNNNLKATDASTKVSVTGGVVSVGNDSITQRAETGSLYKIEVKQDGPGGVVQTINITKVS